jgi:hypothetical protein
MDTKCSQGTVASIFGVENKQRQASIALQLMVTKLIAHIKYSTRFNSLSQFISYLYKAQRVSGDTPPIIRSLKLH